MKLRLAITVVLIAIFSLAMSLWQVFESPVRGAVTAAQLDDTAASYAAAQALRANPVEATCALILFFTLVLTWTYPKSKQP